MSSDLSTPHDQTDPLERTGSPAGPSMSMFAGGLPMRQTRRSATRSLALAPQSRPSLSAIRVGYARLEELAATLGVRAAGAPTIVLLADPVTTAAADWQWQLQLPIEGPVDAAALEEARIERVPGGTYVEVRVPGGMGVLDGFYEFFFKEFLPRYKHELPRPLIVHRLLGDLEARDPKTLDVLVGIPVVLSIDTDE